MFRTIFFNLLIKHSFDKASKMIFVLLTYVIGNSSMNVLPFPSVLSTFILP